MQAAKPTFKLVLVGDGGVGGCVDSVFFLDRTAERGTNIWIWLVLTLVLVCACAAFGVWYVRREVGKGTGDATVTRTHSPMRNAGPGPVQPRPTAPQSTPFTDLGRQDHRALEQAGSAAVQPIEGQPIEGQPTIEGQPIEGQPI